MGQLLVLLLILVVPTAVLVAAGRLVPGWNISRETGAKVGLTALLFATGTGHFARTEGMAAMLPDWVPARTGIILVTGVLELMAAVGLWLPWLTRTVGYCLILMFLGLLPANVYAAVNRVGFGGHEMGPIYLLVRVPFQLLLIGWTYWAAGLSRERQQASCHSAPQRMLEH